MNQNRRLGLSIVLILGLFTTLITSIILSQSSIAQDEYLTFKDILDDYDEVTNQFYSWDDGSIVTIKDEIISINYNRSSFETKIWFESEGAIKGVSKYLVVTGDAESEFSDGDIVLIDIYFYESPPGSGREKITSQISDIGYYEKPEEPDEEKHGIDLLGFHVEFPESLGFLDNNYGRFLVQFLIWLIIAIIVILILDPVIRKATEKTETKIDDIILDIIRRPILILIVLYGVVVSLEELELPIEFMYWVRGAYSIGFFLMMIWIGYRIFQGILIQVGHAVSKRSSIQVDKILVPAIQKLAIVIVAIVVIMAVLGYLNIDLTLFAIGGVVISMVIAFAAQDTLSNFFAGMFLILEPKFKEGDLIYFEEDTYQVKKIGMRTTTMYDLFKHIDVVIPNNKLANEKLINLTEPDRRIKDSCEVGVAYGSDPKKVQDILLDIAMKHPDIITDDNERLPFTRFLEFGDSSLNFRVGFWVRDLDNRFKVKSDINQEIYNRFAKESINIPFPQRDLHIYEHKKE